MSRIFPVARALVLSVAIGAAGAAHATLEGQTVTISESFSSANLGYGSIWYSGPQPTPVTSVVSSAAAERSGTFTAGWIGTTVDIDPSLGQVGVYMTVYPYGILTSIADWHIDLSLSAGRGERFTGLQAVNWNSALAYPGASFQDDVLHLDLSGGYANMVSRGGGSFWAIYQYTAEAVPVGSPPVAAVPEPSTYLLMAAGLVLLAAVSRRRSGAPGRNRTCI